MPDSIFAHASALSCVGDTPLIKLNRVPAARGIKCNVYAKCEFFNAGGSTKDRVAKAMIEQAEKDGRLIPGKSVIVEPTSGNTGIGLSMIGAIKGYKVIIVLPMKMSQEKVNAMKLLGAEVIRTPTEAAHDDPRSNIMVARRIVAENPNAVLLDQFANEANPTAHLVTAEEIIRSLANGIKPVEATQVTKVAAPAAVAEQASSTTSAVVSTLKKLTVESLLPNASQRPLTPDVSPPASVAETHSTVVDALFAGTGTGGTITGVGQRLKRADHNPSCVVVGVDPFGSTIAEPASLNTLPEGHTGAYKIEGVGYDFQPKVLDMSVVDQWIKTEDQESFDMTKELIRTEGLLIGGSSGSVVSAAVRWLKSDGWEAIGSREDKNVVVVLADGLRNYVRSEWLIGDLQ